MQLNTSGLHEAENLINADILQTILSKSFRVYKFNSYTTKIYTLNT